MAKKTKKLKVGKFTIKQEKNLWKKSANDVIRKIYNQNSDIMKQAGEKFNVFKEHIKNNMDRGLTLRQAIEAESRTRTFTSKEEQIRDNFQKNVSKEQSTELRKLSVGGYRKGWKEDFDKTWEWDPNEGRYKHRTQPGVYIEFIKPDEYKKGDSIFQIVRD